MISIFIRQGAEEWKAERKKVEEREKKILSLKEISLSLCSSEVVHGGARECLFGHEAGPDEDEDDFLFQARSPTHRQVGRASVHHSSVKASSLQQPRSRRAIC